MTLARPPNATTTGSPPGCAPCWPPETWANTTGLPASIIVSTTLKDLAAAAGNALTGGGTILPMSDVVRLARHAHHYLAIFDQGKAVALYHRKRLASPGRESSCTPRSVAAQPRAATSKATTVKSTT